MGEPLGARESLIARFPALLVAPLVFRAPSDPAAREIATREPAAWSGRCRSPPVPSGPSGALHTGGTVSLCVSGALARSSPWPAAAHRNRGLSHLISGPLHPYWRAHTQFRMQFPDACSLRSFEKPGISMIACHNMKCARGIACESVLARSCRHLWALRPCPAGQVVRLSETGVAFARSYVRGVETVIAFAGENRAVLVRLLVAVVTVVSTGAVQGRAVVMGVSCWPASVAAEVSLVSKSPRGCVLCARKFALRGLVVGVSAKKFALRAQNGPKMVFSGVLGEFFTKTP